MTTLAVTGGIGSGKSAVCHILSGCGVPVYDSDSRTKALYDSDRCLARRIARAMAAFSPQADVLDTEGKIDRKALASIVFSNPDALAALEALVHPAVLEDFLKWRMQREEEGCRVVAMESAIILEKPLFRDVADKVIVVDAPFALRLERACRRDNAQRDAIEKRMENQRLFNGISNGGTFPDVDYVIVNDSDMTVLKARVDALLTELSVDLERKCKNLNI